VVEGRFKEVVEQVKSLIKEEVLRTPKVTTLVIVLATSKTFILEHLLNKDGEGLVEVLKGEKLRQVMDKFIALFLPNVWNLVAFFKHRPRNRRYVSNILTLKTNSGFDHIQNIVFQGKKLKRKCFCSRCLCMEMIVVVI